VIQRDVELLARMSQVNQALGEIVLRMLPRVQGGALDPVDLRAVGYGLVVLGQQMQRRADELDGPAANAAPPQIEGPADGR